MAFASALLTNGIEVKKAPIGFSWTTLFFGGIPGLFRQDWIWGIVMILLCAITYGFAAIIAAFFYNKVYIKELIKQGYKFQVIAGTDEAYLKTYLGYVDLPKTTNFATN